MDYQQITLISLIAINTIVSIIATLKGNKDLATQAQKQKEKALNKLLKKQEKTQNKFIKQEKAIKELNNNENIDNIKK